MQPSRSSRACFGGIVFDLQVDLQASQQEESVNEDLEHMAVDMRCVCGPCEFPKLLHVWLITILLTLGAIEIHFMCFLLMTLTDW